MNPSSDIRKKLERILSENGALIGELKPSKHEADTLPLLPVGRWENRMVPCNDDISCDVSLIADYFQSTPDPVTGPGTRPFSYGSSFQPAALNRLNDSLQGSGFEAVSRDADIEEVVSVCINVINEIAARNQGLTQRIAVAQSTAKERPKVVFQVKEVPAKQEDPVRDSNDHSETARLRKVCKSQSDRIENLENRLKMKEADVEKLTRLLQEKLKADDRRSALTMENIRGQKLGTSAFVAMDNYQRQIDELRTDNEHLRRRCQNLSVRLRHATERNPNSNFPIN